MEKLYSKQLIVIIILLCISDMRMYTMECAIYKSTFNEQLANQYKSPFTKEDKKKILENTGTSFLKPKGFFQAYIAHSNTIDPDIKNSYLLYKTIQYFAKAHQSILSAPKNNTLTTILASLDKIYDIIHFFKTNRDKYAFTTHIRFNLLFYLALLQDMAYSRKHYYTLDRKLCADIYNIIPNITTPPEEIIANLDKHFNPFIHKTNDDTIPHITIEKLKAFYNKTDTIILPISNLDGTIDTNTFLYFLVKKYILIGCGISPSKAHSEQLHSLTDVMVHDLLHAHIPLTANTHNIINNQLSEKYTILRESFLSLLERIINRTNTCLEKALSENNTEKVIRMKQYLFILFIIIHETIHSYQFYESTTKKAYFKDTLNVLFMMPDFKKLNPNNYVNKKITTYFLFNSFDPLKTICTFDPGIKQTIEELNLSISPTKIERNNTLITNKELKELIDTFVIEQLCTIFNNFFNDELYKDILDKTIFPFTI